MPNRILKESIVTSDNLNELSPEEEVFFYRLMVVCDDFGRMDARPKILLAKCFPLKTDIIKTSKITDWLTALVEQDLLQLYEVEGKQYLYMTTWDKHQQKRAKNSKYPEPPAFTGDSLPLQSSDIICNQVITNVPEKRETRNEKREARSGDENKKTAPSLKTEYAENVRLTEAEYQKLVDAHGEEDVQRLLEILSLYKTSSGKKYKSDYHAIVKWVVTALAEEKQKTQQTRKNQRPRAPNDTQSPASIMQGGDYEIYIPPGGG